MSTTKLRIKAAIAHYNKIKNEDEPIYNQKIIAPLIFPEFTEDHAQFVLSRWICGHGSSVIKPEHVNKVCKLLRVDANFLFGIEDKGTLITKGKTYRVQILKDE